MTIVPKLPPDDIVARLAAGEITPLRERLLQQPPPVPLTPKRGDYDLNPDLQRNATPVLQPAAVLLPIIGGDEPRLVFTRRTEHLSRHAGQVSFPGGRMHEGDISLVQTALRETQEETGIEPAFVTVAGFLDVYETGTGYAILPVVGLLSEGYALVPHAGEVAEIFEVPLAFLLDARNREQGTREWQGHKRLFYAYRYREHYIWGATAGIIVNLAQRLSA
jgi:8-oxo-dGTP pyrophosphatase MutT (NUDIX family)